MKTNSYKVIKILRTNDFLPLTLIAMETTGSYFLWQHVAQAADWPRGELTATIMGLATFTISTVWFGSLHYLTVASWLRLSEQSIKPAEKAEKVIIEAAPEAGYATTTPIKIAGIVYADQHHGKFIHIPTEVQVSHVRKMAYGLLVRGERLSTRTWSEGKSPLLPPKVYDELIKELMRTGLVYRTSTATNAHVRLADEGRAWFASYLYGRVPRSVEKELPPPLPEDWEPN